MEEVELRGGEGGRGRRRLRLGDELVVFAEEVVTVVVGNKRINHDLIDRPPPRRIIPNTHRLYFPNKEASILLHLLSALNGLFSL